MIELTFLGTSSMVPTKERNVQGIFVNCMNEGMLIDCGEGTQRQMNIAGINRNRVKRVLISHWHGDHVSGLIGLIQTIGNCNPDNEKTFYVYGPRGSKKHFSYLVKSVVFENKVNIIVKEVDAKSPKKIFEAEDFFVEAANLRHGTPCIGFRIAEKDSRKMNPSKLEKLGVKGPDAGKLQSGKTVNVNGKTITPDEVSTEKKGKIVSFILDTGVCTNAYRLAEGADLVVCEATFSSQIKEKAEVFRHMTARDAGLIASKGKAQKLILTHFSQRYKTVEEVLEDAKTVFPDTVAAFDFMKEKV